MRWQDKLKECQVELDDWTQNQNRVGSVDWVSGFRAGGREFDSGRTISQGL